MTVATLNGGIDASQELIRVSGTPPSSGTYFTIGSEAFVSLGTGPGPTNRDFHEDYVAVKRGLAGTTKATHLNGASLTPYYPDAPGGTGSTTVTDGETSVAASVVQLPIGTVSDLGGGTAGVELRIAVPGGERTTADLTIVDGWVQQTYVFAGFYHAYLRPGNGHIYVCECYGSERTGMSEPTWPTDGSSVSDGDVTWFDLGVAATYLAQTVVDWEPDTTYATGDLVHFPDTPEVLLALYIGDGGGDSGAGPIRLTTPFDTGGDSRTWYVVARPSVFAVNDAISWMTVFSPGAASVGTVFVYAGQVYLNTWGHNANIQFATGHSMTMIGLPSTDPGSPFALYTDGVPSAGNPKALMVSGG